MEKTSDIHIRLPESQKKEIKQIFGHNLSRVMRNHFDKIVEAEQIKLGCTCFLCHKSQKIDDVNFGWMDFDDGTKNYHFIICKNCHPIVQDLEKIKQWFKEKYPEDNGEAGILLHYGMQNGEDLYHKQRLDFSKAELNKIALDTFKEDPNFEVHKGLIIQNLKKEKND